MIKKIAIYTLLTGFLVSTSSLLLAHFVFKPQFLELNILIHKYCEINIRQNSGIHQQALVFIKKMTWFLPQMKTIPIERESLQPGTQKPYTSQLSAGFSFSKFYFVSTEQELLKALKTAKAGDGITISPGEYHISQRKISLGNAGEVYKPIMLRAAKYGTVTLVLGTHEGFLVDKPFWIFENLIIKGKCSNDSWCEHAFHLVGDADFTVIRNNYITNFNAHIKSNGLQVKKGRAVRAFPDNVQILNNSFVNEWKRNTTSSVTPIDVVGGDNWLIKYNFIADFGKYGRKGKGITYGAFLKGGGKHGMIEENLVACEWKTPHTSSSDIRIGLSLGGGGAGNQYCDGAKCLYEHTFGIIRNNVVVNCHNDVGVYINKAPDSQVYGNYVLGSLGIDIRYKESHAQVYDNQIDGRIKTRDGASIN